MDLFKANKKNQTKRKGMYTNPGVYEVIYHDEWIKKQTLIRRIIKLITNIIKPHRTSTSNIKLKSKWKD